MEGGGRGMRPWGELGHYGAPRGRRRPGWRGPGPEEGREQRRGHSPLVGAGLIEEGEGDGAVHLGPHFPGAAEHGGPIKEALEVLGLGLVPCEGDSPCSFPPSSIPSSPWLPPWDSSQRLNRDSLGFGAWTWGSASV